MKSCCKIQSLCIPVKCDFPMTLSPGKNLSVSSGEEFLSEIEPSIMQPRNVMCLQWMEGIGDESSGSIDAFETEKGVAFKDLPLAMSVDHDLSALASRPAQVRQGKV